MGKKSSGGVRRATLGGSLGHLLVEAGSLKMEEEGHYVQSGEAAAAVAEALQRNASRQKRPWKIR